MAKANPIPIAQAKETSRAIPITANETERNVDEITDGKPERYALLNAST